MAHTMPIRKTMPVGSAPAPEPSAGTDAPRCPHRALLELGEALAVARAAHGDPENHDHRAGALAAHPAARSN
jgi:hypothetical protein